MPADTPVMLHSIDRDGRLLSVGTAWLRRLGYARAEVVGRRVTDFMTEASRSQVLRTVLPELARTGECSNIPVQVLCKDGRGLDMLLSATAEDGDAGPLGRFLAVLVDAPEPARGAATDGMPAHRAERSVKFGHWVWESSPGGRSLVNGCARYSEAAAAIFGVDPAALAVDDETFCQRFVHPDDQDRLRRCLERALQPDQPGYSLDYRIIRADGEVRTVHDVAEKVLTGDGSLVQMMGSVQDITELRQVEQALRDSEERFRTLLDSAPAFLWMTDASGGITYVSRPWCDYTGLPESEGLGLKWVQAIHPEDLPRIRAIESAAFEERRPFAMDYRLRAADGSYRWFLEMGAPRFAFDGTFLGTAGSLVDVTERRRLETELRVSEARLLALADNSPMVIFLKDLEGRYLMVNREFERYHGIGNAEIRGKTAFDFFPAAEAESYTAHDREALAAGVTVQRQVVYSGPNGPRHFSVSKFPVRDSEGSLIGLGGMEMDISDIKRAEAAIRASEERLRSIADSIPALIWMSDQNGDCLFVNKTWLDYTGRTLEEELGRGFADNIHPDDWSTTIETEQAVFEKREIFSTDYRLRGADLEYRWFLDTAAPRFAPDGAYLGHIGILVDITERRRLEAELMLAKEQAETANRTKTQFLANMSHELRTPLNAIIGFSEMMMKEMFGGIGSPHYLEYAGDINQSGRHLLDVINDILDLAKIEAGKLELHEDDCDLPAILRSTLRLVRESAAANRVTLVERIEPLLPTLYADGRAVKQIVLNLLSNAIKFTPERGSVTIGAAFVPGTGMLVSIADTGIGMSPEDIPRALEAFGQIDSSLSRRFEGTGLGLPLTKALAELHGARFELESEPGVGTRVTIVFPLARVGRRERALGPAMPQAVGAGG